MKKSFCLLFCLVIFFGFSSLSIVNSACRDTEHNNYAQTDLSPLDILILDLQDVQRLIQEGDNQTAITILKSSLGQVRKVTEFDKATKKNTEKRIKKGIKLLKKDKNEEALDLLQTAFDALEEGGLLRIKKKRNHNL